MNTLKIKLTAITMAVVLLTAACNPGDRHKKLNNSTDTTAIFKAGSGTQPDTNTINDQRKAAKKDKLNGDTNSNGNADPTGQPSKSNQ